MTSLQSVQNKIDNIFNHNNQVIRFAIIQSFGIINYSIFYMTKYSSETNCISKLLTVVLINNLIWLIQYLIVSI